MGQLKHGVPFDLAQYAFGDPDRVIAEDSGITALVVRRRDPNGSFHLPEE